MIRSLAISLVLLSAARVGLAVETTAAPAKSDAAATKQKTAEEKPTDEAGLDRYRTPFETLTERMIGAASKSVRYDWRKSKIGFGIVGSELLERNNFASGRYGLFARTPFGNFMGEVAITRAFTLSSGSTDLLALTPYRQHGRPSRFELDVNLGYPVAEGVVTAWPSFFPATELVFSLNGGLRYLYYWGALEGAKFLDVTKALLAPELTQRELDNMEASRPGGMRIDTARFGLMAGGSLDLYFQNGGFISPRVLVAVPVFEALDGVGLGWWWELTLSLGWSL